MVSVPGFSFLILSAILFLSTGVAVSDTYHIATDQMIRPSLCGIKKQPWGLLQPPAMCTERSCIHKSEYGKLLSQRDFSDRYDTDRQLVLRGKEYCSEAEVCVGPGISRGSLGIEPPAIYLAPYPNFLDFKSWRWAYEWTLRGRLVDTQIVAGSPSVGGFEAMGRHVPDMKDGRFRLDDGSLAGAMCSTLGAGAIEDSTFGISPVSCIILTKVVGDRTFVLSPVYSRTVIDESCPTSGFFESSVRFALPSGTAISHLTGLVNGHLVSGKLRSNPHSSSIVISDDGAIILSSSGPQLSKLDDRLREKIDISISFQSYYSLSSISGVTGQHLNEFPTRRSIVPPPMMVSFSIRTAAWVGRQNVDPSGNWYWPDDQYYSDLHDEVVSNIESAYSDLCEDHGLVAMSDNENIPVHFYCAISN